MATHSILRGDTMIDGYIADMSAHVMAVYATNGSIYEFDVDHGYAMTHEPPLVLTIDGLIAHRGAQAACGFSATADDIASLESRLGVAFPKMGN